MNISNLQNLYEGVRTSKQLYTNVSCVRYGPCVTTIHKIRFIFTTRHFRTLLVSPDMSCNIISDKFFFLVFLFNFVLHSCKHTVF